MLYLTLFNYFFNLQIRLAQADLNAGVSDGVVDVLGDSVTFVESIASTSSTLPPEINSEKDR